MQMMSFLLSTAASKLLETKKKENQSNAKQHPSSSTLDISNKKPSLPAPHTLAAALDQLELYRNLLDNKIVNQFDAAMEERDFASMAECVTIMLSCKQHSGASLLLSRYISTRPVFQVPVETMMHAATLGGYHRDDHSSTRTTGNPSGNEQNQNQNPHSSISHHSTTMASTSQGTSAMTNSSLTNTNRMDTAGTIDTETQALQAIHSITKLYEILSTCLRDEAVVIEQVFHNMPHAMASLVHRIFDQVVQSAVLSVIKLPPSNASSDQLRAHLKLLSETYRKTLLLAEEASLLVGHSSVAMELSPVELAGTACDVALSKYLTMELAWLGGLGRSKLTSESHGLSNDLILDLLAMNEESVKRCLQVTASEEHAAPAVRLLFVGNSDEGDQLLGGDLHGGSSSSNGTNITAIHTNNNNHPPDAASPLMQSSNPKPLQSPASPSTAPPGGLLQQAAIHIILGLKSITDRCLRRLTTASFQAPSGIDIQQAARAEAAGSFGALLQAIAQISDIISLIQDHYQRAIFPHVACSESEVSKCFDGMIDLMNLVDDKVAQGLERTLVQVFKKLNSTMNDQPRQEFRVDQSTASSPVMLDNPTETCSAVVAMVSAMGEQASSHLHGRNLSCFLAELAQRTALAVEAHASRFVFSVEGGLLWRRDVSEYAACVSRMHGRDARGHHHQAFDELQSLANVLIVPPESLPGIIDGLVPGIDGQRIHRFVERRADYKMARVGDKPLSSLLLRG